MQAESSTVTGVDTERVVAGENPHGRGAIVFDPSRVPQAGAQLFDPGAWDDAARPVSEGGRGQAWFVEGEFGSGVLRHYRRGGLAARLSRDGYLWRGAGATRGFAEFRLLSWLHRQGQPVPAPLAAAYWRRGPFYRADILVDRIPAGRTLASLLSGDHPLPWAGIGRTIAQLHRLGVDHADLNAHNILLDAADKPWLIDFDRGQRRSPGAWRERNLGRLQRSLHKLAPGSQQVELGFASLREAYRSVASGLSR